MSLELHVQRMDCHVALQNQALARYRPVLHANRLMSKQHVFPFTVPACSQRGESPKSTVKTLPAGVKIKAVAKNTVSSWELFGMGCVQRRARQSSWGGRCGWADRQKAAYLVTLQSLKADAAQTRLAFAQFPFVLTHA